MNFKIRKIRSEVVLLYLIVVITSVFPLYRRDTNDYNLNFTLLQIPIILYVLCHAKTFLRRKCYNRPFLYIIVLYFFVFLYESIVFSGCYWSLLYRISTFLMIWILCQYKYRDDDTFILLENFIVSMFTLSVLCSLAFYLWGGDAIILNMEKIVIRRQGVFSDSRLTWLFIHKSAYGLLINAVLSLIVKRRNGMKRTALIILYLIALCFVNSMVSLASAILIIISEYIKTKEITREFLIRLCLMICGASVICFALYYYVIMKKDLSTLGSRLYIWSAVPQLLKKYPHGMGLEFANVTFVVDVMGFNANNLHNVLLNEVLHYGLYAGILFLILLIYIPLYCIKISKNRTSDIVLVLGLILPMMFDQALNDLTFPLYMIILFIRFINYGGIAYVSI